MGLAEALGPPVKDSQEKIVFKRSQAVFTHGNIWSPTKHGPWFLEIIGGGVVDMCWHSQSGLRPIPFLQGQSKPGSAQACNTGRE